MRGGDIASQQQMPDEHPRHAFLRASLRNPAEQDVELNDWAHSVKPEDGRQAFGLLRVIAESKSPDVFVATDWGRSDASCRSWKTEPGEQSFARNSRQLLFAQLSFGCRANWPSDLSEATSPRF